MSMSWNPNQGQDPNQPNQYGGYAPPQPGTPSGGQPNYQQPGGYQQQGYQQSGYGQQPPYGQSPYTYSQPPMGNVSPLGPSSIGMDPKVSAGLGYLILVVGLIFFFIEKQNRFVRFHTLQAVLLAVSLFVLFFVIIFAGIAAAFVNGGLAGLIFSLGNLAVWVGGFIAWLVGMINAFQGKYFKLPVIGDLAERWSSAGIVAM